MVLASQAQEGLGLQTGAKNCECRKWGLTCVSLKRDPEMRIGWNNLFGKRSQEGKEAKTGDDQPELSPNSGERGWAFTLHCRAWAESSQHGGTDVRAGTRGVCWTCGCQGTWMWEGSPTSALPLRALRHCRTQGKSCLSLPI